MKIVVGADFSAIEFKNQIKNYLENIGYEVLDVGQQEGDSQLIYPEAASRVAKAILDKRAEKGIVCCGTGGGVSIVANKWKGIYCVASESIFTAFKMCQLNGANVLALGKNVVGEMNSYEIVTTFLNTNFCQDYGEKRTEFVTRLRNRMLEIENENFK